MKNWLLNNKNILFYIQQYFSKMISKKIPKKSKPDFQTKKIQSNKQL